MVTLKVINVFTLLSELSLFSLMKSSYRIFGFIWNQVCALNASAASHYTYWLVHISIRWVCFIPNLALPKSCRFQISETGISVYCWVQLCYSFCDRWSSFFDNIEWCNSDKENVYHKSCYYLMGQHNIKAKQRYSKTFRKNTGKTSWDLLHQPKQQNHLFPTVNVTQVSPYSFPANKNWHTVMNPLISMNSPVHALFLTPWIREVTSADRIWHPVMLWLLRAQGQ